MEKKSYAERYARFVMSHRRAFVLVMFASTLFMAFFLNQVNLRNDPDSLLPLSNPYIATNLYSEHTYGMGNLMVWGLRVKEGDIYQPWFVRLVDEIYDDVTKLEFANAGNFVGIPSSKLRHMGITENGSLEFGRMIPINGLSDNPAEEARQIAYLKEGLEKHPVMEALLTYYEDEDGNKCEMLDKNGLITNESVDRVHHQCTAKATFIVGDFSNGLKDDPIKWIRATKAQFAKYEEKYGDRVEFLISGEPYFLTAMIQEVWDKSWLFGISLLIVILVLWYEYRSMSAAIFPLLGVTMTIVLTLGLMGFSQFKLTTMMVLTPVLLLAIGIGHSMQITRRFMQEYEASGDTESAAETAIQHTIVPAALSIGTDLHGFFALSFVDISFYQAYAWFGIFGMSTLILTTTTLIPLLFIWFPPPSRADQGERRWEVRMGSSITRLLTGPGKWLPVACVAAVIVISGYFTGIHKGIGALMAGDAGRSDPEVARIQDEFDIMPDVEKGINYPRAAFKDQYLLGDLLYGDGTVRPIYDLTNLSNMMPGVITANMAVRSRKATLPPCGLDAYNDEGDRVIGPDRCYDEQEDPAQGVYNDAEVMEAVSKFEDWMRSHPHIGYTASYVQFIKTLNMLLNAPYGEEPMRHMNLYAIPTLKHMQANRYAYADPDDPDYLPDPDAAVQLMNGMLANNTGPGDLDSFVNTRTWNEGSVMGFINTMDPIELHTTITDIQDYLIIHANDPGMDKIHIGVSQGEVIPLSHDEDAATITTTESRSGKPAIGGFLGITEATRDVAFAEFLKAPAGTAFTVFTMSVIMFRSWLVASLLMSMVFVTLVSQYGLGGYLTHIKEWSANLAFHTQVALSIAMGLGVDYGVYMVSRLREEMSANGNNWHDALQTTISTTGSAIVLSVVVLLGSFIPLMNSELANLWSVSLYIGEALIMDVLLALFFMPIIIWWFKPKYVFGNKPD